MVTMWWVYIVVPALLILGGYGFAVLVGFETRMLTRKTSRSAENMYGGHAQLTRKQRRQARQHSGEG
jgi:hypothetical protein